MFLQNGQDFFAKTHEDWSIIPSIIYGFTGPFVSGCEKNPSKHPETNLHKPDFLVKMDVSVKMVNIQKHQFLPDFTK